jgi:hypothetical protein
MKRTVILGVLVTLGVLFRLRPPDFRIQHRLDSKFKK